MAAGGRGAGAAGILTAVAAALMAVLLVLAQFVWPAVVLFAGVLAAIAFVYLRNQARRRRISRRAIADQD
jgi:Flp pilus assembly protein TadB